MSALTSDINFLSGPSLRLLVLTALLALLIAVLLRLLRQWVTTETWRCSACTFENSRERPGCSMCATPRPPQASPAAPTVNSSQGPEVTEKTWVCPTCTFENIRERPGCQICAAERPIEAIPDRGVDKFLLIDGQKVIVPEEEFECPSCFNDIPPGNGIRLRECLCEICVDCVRLGIEASGDGVLKCPSCSISLCDRDIKNLLTPEQWEKRLIRSLRSAEAKAKSFHCLTPNCRGWTDVSAVSKGQASSPFFLCSSCSKVNCTECKAQHEGKTCGEYREDLKKKKQNHDIRMSEKFLEDLIKKGEAMRCPGCSSVVQKVGGCGFVRCGNPSCKLGLCWFTKAIRWGPKGRNDNSRGCQCNPSKRCHPLCRGCDY